MAATVAELTLADLPAATEVLAASCGYDRAATVAAEKLFGASPRGTPCAFGARLGGILLGVAVACGDRIRLIAVHPAARGQGLGGALLAHCETAIWRTAARRARTLDEPGNYLAPGIDDRNSATIAWLERRAWQRAGELRENVLIRVRDNPRVTHQRAAELVAACAAKGYDVRRARSDEYPLLDAVSSEFGGAWPFELARALELPSPGVHVALRDGAYCAFAAHDGNNQGLGWFGPTGTWPAHRGQGLGEAVLVACLVDVAREHEYCEVAWIGPRPFYDKVAGVASDRRFVLLTKPL